MSNDKSITPPDPVYIWNTRFQSYNGIFNFLNFVLLISLDFSHVVGRQSRKGKDFLLFLKHFTTFSWVYLCYSINFICIYRFGHLPILDTGFILIMRKHDRCVVGVCSNNKKLYGDFMKQSNVTGK